MINAHENDTAYMSTRWLFRQMQDRGLVPSYLIRATYKTTKTTHIIAIFPDGRYVCDCCMGTNLGIVCCHFFLAWTKMDGLPSHISLIRARLDVKDIPTITFLGKQARNVQFTAQALPKASVSNPLSVVSHAPRATETIPQREVYHSIQSDICPLMNRMQTREQLEQLQAALAQVQ
ncbi:hypothetical protein DFH09DRAFT_911584 [Mycena vulgaris]|nr:hypothetical protein DFH09DRAFT_911584 [Mycena vulgaris]